MTNEAALRRWHSIETAEIAASASAVWEVVGGFFTMHLWHPDIESTEIVPSQVDDHGIQRFLTFPGPPVSTTTEELVSLDEERLGYRYRWVAGHWGEVVQQYHSALDVIETAPDVSCLVRWQGWFLDDSDAVSDFYRRGLDSLSQRFGASQ